MVVLSLTLTGHYTDFKKCWCIDGLQCVGNSHFETGKGYHKILAMSEYHQLKDVLTPSSVELPACSILPNAAHGP